MRHVVVQMSFMSFHDGYEGSTATHQGLEKICGDQCASVFLRFARLGRNGVFFMSSPLCVACPLFLLPSSTGGE